MNIVRGDDEERSSNDACARQQGIKRLLGCWVQIVPFTPNIVYPIFYSI